MLKKTITISLILPALACGPDTIVVIPQDQVDLPIDQLEYLEVNTEEEEVFYAERHELEPEQAPEEEALEEEEIQEEQPIEEEFVEEDEEVLEEDPVEEEEEIIEEEVEEEIIEESEPSFSGECNLEGGIYNFQSSCIYPLACLSRHEDNHEVIPETGFCGKVCFGHSNCPGDTQCVMNGVTPGVGYCER
jgi:hypothetical protein